MDDTPLTKQEIEQIQASFASKKGPEADAIARLISHINYQNKQVASYLKACDLYGEMADRVKASNREMQKSIDSLTFACDVLVAAAKINR